MPGFTTHYILGMKAYNDMPQNNLKFIIAKYRWPRLGPLITQLAGTVKNRQGTLNNREMPAHAEQHMADHKHYC